LEGVAGKVGIDLADNMADDLAHDGYCTRADYFLPSEVDEVTDIIGKVVERRGEIVSLGLQKGQRLVADIADIDMPLTEACQLEIFHLTKLYPKLTQTSLFRKIVDISHSIDDRLRFIADHVIIKPPESQSITDWHQDLACTRGGRDFPWPTDGRFHFWIPLQDVTDIGGCMEFIPGSHRSGPLPHRAVPRRSGNRSLVATPDDLRDVVKAPIRKGGFSIHCGHTLHRTGANKEENYRLAWIIQFARFGALRGNLRRLRGREPIVALSL
jgi:hypothetical protein